MSLLNKEKVLNGVDKAVDAVNSTADKAENYIKENELDKKAKNIAKSIEEGVISVGESIENFFKK